MYQIRFIFVTNLIQKKPQKITVITNSGDTVKVKEARPGLIISLSFKCKYSRYRWLGKFYPMVPLYKKKERTSLRFLISLVEFLLRSFIIKSVLVHLNKLLKYAIIFPLHSHAKKQSSMSIIRLPLLYVGSKNEKVLYTLFDSGADLSCINPTLIGEIETPVSLGRIRRVATASEGHFIEIKERITLDFYINDILLSDEFILVPGLSEEAIIGAATLQKWRIKLDFEHDRVIVDPKVGKLQLI